MSGQVAESGVPRYGAEQDSLFRDFPRVLGRLARVFGFRHLDEIGQLVTAQYHELV